METLDDSFRLLQPFLPDELVASGAERAVRRIVARLPPIHCAGLEVRLGDDARVDLIQRLRAVAGEPARMARHIEETALGERPDWARLAGFCRRWSDPRSSLWTMVATAFIGLDVDAKDDDLPTPSLYLSLEPGAGADRQALAELLDAAARTLRGAPLSTGVLDTVAAAHRALPDGAAVADVGFMLARDVDAIRLVVAHVPRRAAAAFLAALPWAGAEPRIADAVALLPRALDHVILSLDVGARVLPRVGLEYDPGYHEDDVPVWDDSLGRLVDAGLCSDAKRQALIAWPGHVEPDAVAAAWPASLLMESLLNRADRFLVLARRLTFLKLVYGADGALLAKAYFGYGPRSLSVAGAGHRLDEAPRESEASPAQAPATATDGEVSVAKLAQAAMHAAGFLLARRDAEGLWREFPRILGGTDEWVSAYIAGVLARLDDEDCRRAAAAAWDALCRRRDGDGGLGYNRDLPVDADSTAWAVRLAEALGAGSRAAAVDAARVLRRHQLDDGGVATYVPAAAPELRRLLGDADLDGLFVAHTCVTAAAAAPAALAEACAPFLLQAQEADGRWRGYWWSDDEYTTWLAVDALVRNRVDGADAARAAARDWALRRFDRDQVVWSRGLTAPSTFATALCIGILVSTTEDTQGVPLNEPALHFPRPEDSPLRPALRWLLRSQHADGGWDAAALMRMPPTDAVDGDARPEATAVSADENRLFTTATVVRILTRLTAPARSAP